MKQHFNIDYPSAAYLLQNVLKPALGDYEQHNENVLATHPQYQNAATQCGVTQILRMATFDLDTPLEVFDITLADTVRISQSRVNIQRVVRSLLDV
jgi:hypothetical protein